MISIIYNEEQGVAGVRLHQTVYSPEALTHLAVEAERYRTALETIALTLVADPYAFAAAVVEGQAVGEAITADLEALTAPSTPEDDAAAERVLRRRAVVCAALKLHRHEQEAGSYPATAYRPWQEAEAALYAACAAFREVGGSEVTG